MPIASLRALRFTTRDMETSMTIALRSLLLTLAVLATACGGSAETDTAATEEDTTETTVTETTVAAETTAAPETTEAPADTQPAVEETTQATAAEADGMAVYEANCARCHGSDGAGRSGPSLLGHGDDHGDTVRDIGLVTNGGKNMPAFGDKLLEDEIVAVVDYVYEAFPTAPAE